MKNAAGRPFPLLSLFRRITQLSFREKALRDVNADMLLKISRFIIEQEKLRSAASIEFKQCGNYSYIRRINPSFPHEDTYFGMFSTIYLQQESNIRVLKVTLKIGSSVIWILALIFCFLIVLILSPEFSFTLALSICATIILIFTYVVLHNVSRIKMLVQNAMRAESARE